MKEELLHSVRGTLCKVQSMSILGGGLGACPHRNVFEDTQMCNFSDISLLASYINMLKPICWEGSDTLEISYASSEITFEIMKLHTQKKSEITLLKNENCKISYISVNYGCIDWRDIILIGT